MRRLLEMQHSGGRESLVGTYDVPVDAFDWALRVAAHPTTTVTLTLESKTYKTVLFEGLVGNYAAAMPSVPSMLPGDTLVLRTKSQKPGRYHLEMAFRLPPGVILEGDACAVS